MVLPLVLILVLCLLEVGLLVKDRLVLEGSARAGAREAAVSLDDAEVRQAVLDAAPSLDTGAIGVSVTREGGAGTAATVEVTYRAVVAIPLIDWLFPSAIDLSATAVMRQETG
jgi:hypothetical protein